MPEAPSEGRLQDELRSYYGPLLPHWDRSLQHRGDLGFWRRAASRRPGRTALELGAGSGRVTEVLAGAGRSVVGLDLNPEAVRRARERLGERDGVHLLVADMRTFRLDRRFGLVVAANDPFSHLRSDRGRDRGLRRVAEHLADDGRFLLDALWFPEGWLEEATGPEGKVIRQRTGGDGAPALEIRQRWRCDRSDRTCVAKFRVEGGPEPITSVFHGRWWTPEELEERLGSAGLRVRRRWGDYEGSEWSREASHLVVEAVPR